MFLSSQCFFSELTDDLLSTCQPFSCGNEDLDDFFKNDATRYAYSVSYTHLIILFSKE